MAVRIFEISFVKKGLFTLAIHRNKREFETYKEALAFFRNHFSKQRPLIEMALLLLVQQTVDVGLRHTAVEE